MRQKRFLEHAAKNNNIKASGKKKQGLILFFSRENVTFVNTEGRSLNIVLQASALAFRSYL